MTDNSLPDHKEYSLVIATAGSKDNARSIAKRLVELRLAACVQMSPIESVYRWNEGICEDAEVLLVIKSRTDRFEAIKAAIKENHPYEVPEILQVPISDGLPAYLAWIDDCTREATP